MGVLIISSANKNMHINLWLPKSRTRILKRKLNRTEVYHWNRFRKLYFQNILDKSFAGFFYPKDSYCQKEDMVKNMTWGNYRKLQNEIEKMTHKTFRRHSLQMAIFRREWNISELYKQWKEYQSGANVKGKTWNNKYIKTGRADLFSSLPEIKFCCEAKLTN